MDLLLEAKSDDEEIDEDLLAMEKLDRDSPELWPEKGKKPQTKNTQFDYSYDA